MPSFILSSKMCGKRKCSALISFYINSSTILRGNVARNMVKHSKKGGNLNLPKNLIDALNCIILQHFLN